MKYRVLGVLLMLLAAAFLLPVKAEAETVVAAGFCGDSVTWKLEDDGVLTISGSGCMFDYPCRRPSSWGGYEDAISSVRIENGVTSIGNYAFHDCEGLTNITIGNDVTRIGCRSFGNCTKLKQIRFAGDKPEIDQEAFLDVTTTACYPVRNATWMHSAGDYYGGALTWKPYLPNVVINKVIPHRTGNILYWDAVDGIEIYQIYRMRIGETSWTLLENTRSLGYKDKTALPGVEYSYKIVARNAAYKSEDSETVQLIRPYRRQRSWTM